MHKNPRQVSEKSWLGPVHGEMASNNDNAHDDNSNSNEMDYAERATRLMDAFNKWEKQFEENGEVVGKKNKLKFH